MFIINDKLINNCIILDISYTSSHSSTNLINLFGFYDGGGLITSGNCNIPSKSVQFTLSVTTEKI